MKQIRPRGAPQATVVHCLVLTLYVHEARRGIEIRFDIH